MVETDLTATTCSSNLDLPFVTGDGEDLGDLEELAKYDLIYHMAGLGI
jgi:hypothetical protein